MTTSTCWPRIGPARYRTTTHEDQVRREAYSQVDEHLKASAQVVESAPRTLSRWRHGFEPRWDYEHKGPGQGTSMKAFGRLNRDSNAEYPENIPSRIERSEVRESPRGMHWSYSQLAPPPLRRSRQNKRSPDRTSWSSCHDQAVLYDVDLHVVSALFRLREGADRGVDVWFWCHQTGEFEVQVNEGPIAEALVTACRSGASGAECSESDAARQRTRIHVLFYLVEHDPQT
jgi:hypothetical protein